ncbi:hypothetical protein Tco_0912387 [Tanacetum coccineum]
MLEDIRIYMMQRVVISQNAMDLEDIITPSVRRQLEKPKTQQRNWVVIPSGFQELEVSKRDESYGVNLVRKQCQYRFWEITGIPCVHAIAGYMHLNRDPDVGVSECNCLEVGHNKTTCDKDPVPKTPKPRKPPGRKSQTENVAYASSKGRGRGSRGGGSGRRGAHAGRGGSGRADNIGGRKRLAREKEILERQDEKALQQAMEEEREYQRQDKEIEKYYKEQRQWDFDNDYLNPKNFTISEDEIDVVHIASSDVVEPAVAEGVYNAFDVVEHAVAEGLVQDQMIDKVVVAKEGSTTKTEAGQREDSKKQAKNFKTDDDETGLSAHNALSLSESE